MTIRAIKTEDSMNTTDPVLLKRRELEQIGAGLWITTHILGGPDCFVLQTGTREGDVEMRRRWSSRSERISQMLTKRPKERSLVRSVAI